MEEYINGEIKGIKVVYEIGWGRRYNSRVYRGSLRSNNKKLIVLINRNN